MVSLTYFRRVTCLSLLTCFLSQLCAASTVGVAATGFAFGRVERASKSHESRRRSFFLHHRHRSSSFATDVPDRTTTPTTPDIRPRSSSRLSAIIESTFRSNTNHIENHVNDVSDSCQAARPESRREPWFNSSGPRRLRRRGYTNPTLTNSQDDPAASHFKRPSSSWLRRLSITSFQTESPVPSPTSATASFGSNIARPPSRRREPNRLVKRSNSQHLRANPLLVNTSRSASLRRPATSYQRSETSARRAPAHTGTGEFEKNSNWRPYLASSSNESPDRWVRPRSAPGLSVDDAIHRILPDPYVVPALLLATSITRKEPENDIGTSRRISTAPGDLRFHDPFDNVNTSLHAAEQSLPSEAVLKNEPETTVAPTTSETEPDNPPGGQNLQISVSLSRPESIVSMTASNAGTVRKFSGSGSLRRVKGRTFASNLTLSELSNLEGATSGSQRSGRRNVTDPSIFYDPATATQHPYPAPYFSGISEPFGNPVSAPLSRASTDMTRLRGIARRSSTSDAVPLSPSQFAFYRQPDPTWSPPFRQRMKRLSIATSDPASTVISSDETHTFTSGGEEETDFLSETAFDSVRTYATASSYSRPARGPRIETVFDENDPYGPTKERLASLEELLPHGSFSARLSGLGSQASGNNEDSIFVPSGTPRTNENLPVAQESEKISVARSVSLKSNLSEARSLVGPLPNDLNGWSCRASRAVFPLAGGRDTSDEEGHIFPKSEDSATSTAFPLQHSRARHHRQPSLNSSHKANIFDWSEQPELSGSNARPTTVHGKQGSDSRASRPPIRKAPNTLHLRSQSVPAAREPPANEPQQASAKFGTWGLGSKGASEDWDSDFEFDDSEGSLNNDSGKSNKKTGQRGMIVPQAIMERQASLYGQFGQVQELTLLVEELKRLRHQANHLNIVNGSSSELWKEADSIVRLATVNDDDDDNSPPRSPSSLTFSFDDSEEESHDVDEPEKHRSGASFPDTAPEQINSSSSASPDQPPEDPTAKGTSVLDLIYQRRTSPDSLCLDTGVSRPRKLPFDTQSLHDLVSRAGAVTRALKDVIRKAEGVAPASVDEVLQPNPPFSRIFDQPQGGLLEV